MSIGTIEITKHEILEGWYRIAPVGDRAISMDKKHLITRIQMYEKFLEGDMRLIRQDIQLQAWLTEPTLKQTCHERTLRSVKTWRRHRAIIKQLKFALCFMVLSIQG